MELFAKTCSTDRMNMERLFARVFVVIGGLIWLFMLVASETAQRYSDLAYSLQDVGNAIVSAAIPFVIAAAVFVLGLFYERLTAVVLLVGAVAVIVYGFVAAWDGALWALVLGLLVAPMVIAAVLYLLAARTQQVCEMEGAV